MRQWWVVVTVFGLVVAGGMPAAAAAGNQSPHAAAGLDQTVQRGATVYLDAGGSYDRDGSIERVEWTMTAPNGSTLVPSCRTCTTPTFTPNATGRWAVTARVTDDDGATTSDTLYVTVEEQRGPAVSLDAPAKATRNVLVPVTIEASASEAPLQRVALYRDGTRIDQVPVSGDDAAVTANHSFPSNGTATLRAVATDRQGYVTTTTASVNVVDVPTVSPSGGDGGGIETKCPNPDEYPVWGYEQDDYMCTSNSLISQSPVEDETYVTPTPNGDIRMYKADQGEVVQVATTAQVNELTRGDDNLITLDEVNSVYQENKKNGKYEDGDGKSIPEEDKDPGTDPDPPDDVPCDHPKQTCDNSDENDGGNSDAPNGGNTSPSGGDGDSDPPDDVPCGHPKQTCDNSSGEDDKPKGYNPGRY
jgi:hypothetical protein